MNQNIVLWTDDKWIYGKTLSEEGEFLSYWTKLTDKEYNKKFWFAKTPKEYFAEFKNFEIDHKTSDSLTNLFAEKWIDFAYFINDLVEGKLRETINLFIGPIAQHSKETKIPVLSCLSTNNLRQLIQDELTFNEKKAIVADLMTTDLSYADIRKKHVFEGISDDVIEVGLRKVIAENDAQWKKAQNVPNLLNWFVGQIMKEHKGKINAANVMKVLEKIKGEM